jgi:REP-associated tyrosine transposase
LLDQPFYGWVTAAEIPIEAALAAFSRKALAMSRRSYSEINLHFVWHVKASLPIITSEIEPRLHRYIRSYALQTKDLILHEIGGTETHVHLAVTIPPTLLISEWVGRLKGASSHYVNHQLLNRKMLDWQSGYGVVSFGTKDLEWVVAYIRNQKEHHKKGAAVERLERSTNDEEDEC